MRYRKQIVSIMTLAILLLLMMSTIVQAVRIEKINNFSATMSGNHMKLTWSSATGVVGYYVYVNGTKIGSVNTNEASLIGFSENTTYQLKVTGYTSAKVEVAISEEISFTATQPKKLEQVKNMTVTQVNGYVTLNWSAVNNANKYQVFVDVPGFGNVNVGEVTTTNAVLKGFSDGLRYGFSVRACQSLNTDTTNYGEKSEAQYVVIDYHKDDTNQDNNNPTRPDNVENVKIYNVEETTAMISWSKVKNADAYEIRLSKNYGQYEVIRDTYQEEVSLSNLTPDSYYRVKIVAYKLVNGDKVYGDEATYYSFTTKKEKIIVGNINEISVYNIQEREATVSWSQASNADSYDVSISKNNGAYKNVADTSKREVNLTNLDPSSYYKVKVVAYKWVDGKKQLGGEAIREFTTKDEKITVDKVYGVDVDDVTRNSADISWRKVDNADGYEVLLAERNERYEVVKDTSRTVAYLDDLEPNTRYKVKVVAYKKVNGKKQRGEESSYRSFTTEKRVYVDNVSYISIDKLTYNRAEISWPRAGEETGYYIYLAQGNGDFKYKGSTKNRNYTFTGLKASTYYQVMVEPYKIVDGEEYIPANAKTKGFTTAKVTNPDTGNTVTKPAKVTGVTSEVRNRNQAYITWNKVTGATGYEVWTSKAGGSWQCSAYTTGTQTTLKDLGYSTSYRVQVIAYKKYKENGQDKTLHGQGSTIVSFKTQTNLNNTNLGKVTGLKVIMDGSNATLSWKAVTGATGYEVYYEVPNVGAHRVYSSATYKILSGVATSKISYCTARVRAYKTVNGEKVYGAYSDIIRFRKN